MEKLLNPQVLVTADGDDIPLDVNADDEAHCLKVHTDQGNGDVYFEFTSRVALYDFARELLRVSIFQKGTQVEFRPQRINGVLENLNGVRMSEDSPRLFVSYPSD